MARLRVSAERSRSLNLVIVRMAFVYGPYVNFGQREDIERLYKLYININTPISLFSFPGRR
jgi:hypothetical protein